MAGRAAPLVAILGLLALLGAGCSGAGDGGSGADAKPVATDTVLMPKSYRFEPEAITVEAGTTVTWKNEDNFTHDVSIETDGKTREHTVEPGDEVEITFDEPGTYDYVCRFHEHDMHGSVTVT